MAFRNLLRQRRRSLLTMLTMLGGFTLAAVSIGWSDGSYANIIDAFTRNRLGHIQIHGRGYLDKPSLYNTIDEYESIGRSLVTTPGVEEWAPRVYAAGLVAVADKSAGAQIIGIDPQRENSATRFDRKVATGATFAPEATGQALLGKGLAKVLHARLGDEIVIVSQAADGAIANALYRLTGVVESGDEFVDRTALYLSLHEAQNLLALEGRVHEIAVIVQDLHRVSDLANALTRTLDDATLEVLPWQEFAKSFHQAMQADVKGMWIMLFVIMLIVAVGVLNTVLMSVLERRREYGVLRALGTRPLQILGLVVLEVSLLALVSVIGGAGLGVLANHLLAEHGIRMPQAFTYGGVEFSVLYSVVNARSIYIPALTVFFTAAVVSVIPALQAAHIDPARAMRQH